MKLSPLEVKKREFKTKMRGYDPQEVRAFLEMVSRDMEDTEREIRELYEKMEEMQKLLDHYKEMEETIKSAMMTAQKAAEDMKNNAEREAELIVEKARVQAQEIISQAQKEHDELLNSLESKKSRLENEIKMLERKRRAILEDLYNTLNLHLGLVKEEFEKEKLNLLEGEEEVKDVRSQEEDTGSSELSETGD